MGAMDQKTVEEILDFFYEQGGNFIDTANNYQEEQSEKWIGEWLRKRGNRDQMGTYYLVPPCLLHQAAQVSPEHRPDFVW
jgi:predicted aldo/keto reductase-like oxidoreductase